MTVKEHELRLNINADAARAGARDFTAALSAVRKAVEGLERDTEGAFTKLKSLKPHFDVTPITKATTETNTLSKALTSAGTASAKIGTTTQRAALAASMALRQASTSAQKLAFRLDDLGDTAALDQLDAGLDRLHAQLRRAPDLAGVRTARNEYENLRTELTQAATAAEYAKGAQAQLDRQMKETARAAEQQAESLSRIRAAHDPVFAASQRYAQALGEIDRLTAANVLNENQANAARERAAQTYLALDRAADGYNASGGRANAATMNLMYNFQDLGVMLAAGQNPLMLAAQQGTQIGAALESSGAKGKQVFGLLKEAALSVVSPVNLITIGAIAAGAALFYAFQKAIPPTKTLKEALSDLDSALSKAKTTSREAGDMSHMVETYGAATKEVQALVTARKDLARLDAQDALKAAQKSLYEEFGGVDMWDSLAGFADTAQGRARMLASQLDLSAEAAQRLEASMQKARTETNAQAMADQYGAMRKQIVDSAGGLDKLSAAQKTFVKGLTEAESKAREFVALDMAKPVTTAKTATDSLAGSMGGVAAQAERVLNTLKALAGIRINISAPTITTPSLPKATPISTAPATSTTPATPKSTGGSLFDRLTNITDVAFRTPAATKPAAAMTVGEMQAVITASVSHTGAMQEEKTAAEELTDSLKERLTSLQAETLTLQTVAAGTYATEEAARLYAEASLTSKGAIDQQTAAMIRQIDVAAKLNEELTKAARDPVREWMASVPTWQQAGQQIETQALSSLSDAIAGMATTGKFDIEALGNSILQTAAKVAADMAVREMVGLFGGNVTGTGTGGFGLGNVLGAMFGGSVGAFSEGGYSTRPVGFAPMAAANFRNAPHYAQGTTNTSGIPAVLHPNEAVIPLSKGRKIPVDMGDSAGGGTVVHMPQHITINTPDADSFRRSKKQLAADLAETGQRAVRSIR